MGKALVVRSWNRLRARHEQELADEVVRYCIGHEHELDKLADALGQSVAWVKQRLRFAAADANDCVYQDEAKRILQCQLSGQGAKLSESDFDPLCPKCKRLIDGCYGGCLVCDLEDDDD